MIAFPDSPEGGYIAVDVERREWWQFPGVRYLARAAAMTTFLAAAFIAIKVLA